MKKFLLVLLVSVLSLSVYAKGQKEGGDREPRNQTKTSVSDSFASSGSQMNRVVTSSTYDPKTGTTTEFYGVQSGTKDKLTTYMKEVTTYADGSKVIKEGSPDKLAITRVPAKKNSRRHGRDD